MDILLGHIVWASIFRPALLLLDVCYAFSREHQASRGHLWPAVVRELDAISTLLPLFRAELSRPWFHRVVASDASPYGLGVCHRSLDRRVVGAIGRTVGTWRCQDGTSAAARRHAMGVADDQDDLRPPGPDPDVDEEVLVPWAVARSFAEVPEEIMQDRNWLVVHSRGLATAENILRSEARAWLWAVKHVIRDRSALGHRVLTHVGGQHAVGLRSR